MSEELLPMREVVSMTGVNAMTLRAWERRYGLVSPRRGPGGHRLFTRADVDRLRSVVALLDSGMRIGRAAKLVAAGGGTAAPEASEGDARCLRLVAHLLSAAETLDEEAARRAYAEAIALYPVEKVIDNVLVPVLYELGVRWARRRGGIAEEHFFTTFVRNELGAAMQRLSPGARGPRLLAACMPDERHDLGLLMFSTVAARRGYRVVVLGAAVPLRELAPAVRASAPGALLLSMTMRPARGVVDEGLSALVRAVDVPVLVGGARAEAERDAIEAAGARVVGATFDPALEWLDAHLGA